MTPKKFYDWQTAGGTDVAHFSRKATAVDPEADRAMIITDKSKDLSQSAVSKTTKRPF